jgi:hypothetical protein
MNSARCLAVRISALFWATIAREVHSGRSPNRFPSGSIYNDIDAVAAYSSFCNAMFADKETAHFAAQRELKDELAANRRLFSLRANERAAFIADLESIEDGASADHLRLIEEVCGPDSATPFEELLSVVCFSSRARQLGSSPGLLKKQAKKSFEAAPNVMTSRSDLTVENPEIAPEKIPRHCGTNCGCRWTNGGPSGESSSLTNCEAKISSKTLGLLPILDRPKQVLAYVDRVGEFRCFGPYFPTGKKAQSKNAPATDANMTAFLPNGIDRRFNHTIAEAWAQISA